MLTHVSVFVDIIWSPWFKRLALYYVSLVFLINKHLLGMRYSVCQDSLLSLFTVTVDLLCYCYTALIFMDYKLVLFIIKMIVLHRDGERSLAALQAL